VNGLIEYSDAWITTNSSPNIKQYKKPLITDFFCFNNNSWWDHVKKAPDVKSRAVPAVEAPNGLGFIIDFGGHIIPISKIGTRELVKKDQKNPTNNKISLIINKINPTTNPFRTILVWQPKFLSSLISVIHRKAQKIESNIPDTTKIIELKLNKFIKPKTIVKNPTDIIIGQGLWSTKW